MNQLHGAKSSHYIKFTSCTIVALMLIQLVACNHLGRGKDGGQNYAAETLSESKETGLPLLVLRQQSPSSASSSSNGGSGNGGSSSNNNGGSGSSSGATKPDFFLIWMLPYEDFIPKPVMDMINQQVRPQTEQISQQVVSQVPGAQEFWSTLSQLQSTISNMGGLQSVLGSLGGGSGGNPLSGFGRR